MAGLLRYVKDYGDISFTEMPFCEADNAALCGMFYMPIEKAAPNGIDSEPMLFRDCCNKMYEINGNRHIAIGLVLLKGISVEMMEMGKSKRFGEMKITNAKEYFCDEPAVQFGAATFLLDDGNIVILFRGTDDSFTGWIEDLDIYTKKGIPSHRLAVDYINEVADKFEGNIIICGHSKGGNVALYGALNCKKEAKDRIAAVYNNDGPGFCNFDYINSEDYRNLLPKYRHFVPNSTLVGILLAHDDDFTVIKSSRLLGPMQHDIATWQIEGTEFVKKPDLTPIAKIADLTFLNIFMKISDEDCDILEEVLISVVKGTGQTCLKDLARHAVSAVNNASKVWKAYDEATKLAFKGIFKGSSRYLKTAIKVVKEDAVPSVQKRAYDLASVLMA